MSDRDLPVEPSGKKHRECGWTQAVYGVALRTVGCVIKGNVTCSMERGDRGVRGALLCCLGRGVDRSLFGNK